MMHNLRFDRGNEQATAEIRLPNKKNPNGFIIRADARGKPKVERYINLVWARRHGYVDAYDTASGRKRQQPRRPGVGEKSCASFAPCAAGWGCERQAGHSGKHMAWDNYPKSFYSGGVW